MYDATIKENIMPSDSVELSPEQRKPQLNPRLHTQETQDLKLGIQTGDENRAIQAMQQFAVVAGIDQDGNRFNFFADALRQKNPDLVFRMAKYLIGRRKIDYIMNYPDSTNNTPWQIIQDYFIKKVDLVDPKVKEIFTMLIRLKII